ncbi:MAG: hypothetical protein IH606_08180 [Burkholderiales bacterium]|nr:hypothetical protein [Burkholderiales bacterium]
MSAEQKLKEFRRLTKDRGIVKKDRSAPTLDKWIERAHGARGVRNIYIHGHWSLLLPTAERPVTLHAPPWMSKNLGLDSPIEMTLSELHDMADNMESLSNDFIKLKNTLGV